MDPVDKTSLKTGDLIPVGQNKTKCNQFSALKCQFSSKLTVVHVDSLGELPLHVSVSCAKLLYIL